MLRGQRKDVLIAPLALAMPEARTSKTQVTTQTNPPPNATLENPKSTLQ